MAVAGVAKKFKILQKFTHHSIRVTVISLHDLFWSVCHALCKSPLVPYDTFIYRSIHHVLSTLSLQNEETFIPGLSFFSQLNFQTFFSEFFLLSTHSQLPTHSFFYFSFSHLKNEQLTGLHGQSPKRHFLILFLYFIVM